MYAGVKSDDCRVHPIMSTCISVASLLYVGVEVFDPRVQRRILLLMSRVDLQDGTQTAKLLLGQLSSFGKGWDDVREYVF